MSEKRPPRPIGANRCDDCGVSPGKPHERGCQVETCVFCGGQAINCNCVYLVNGIHPATLETVRPDLWSSGPTDEMAKKFEEAEAKLGGPILWSGEWHGMATCRELGWFVQGARGASSSIPDMNRYGRACAGREPGFRWDPSARRLVRTG